ncbi:lactonase family protein [Zobellia galactanivorans]|uniref:6-phosphogluconolactonase-like protein n=1 Tax=Zobellia galactanivorans (strain DSM 12802 / CCUG 47099 / CIP 106680 / NCIMB 13871 / Dsij) TaxID=63186 RepID=G0L2N5_ZOBGA|nr:lactonase family protein [Zobellia galactanivorans]CAZ95093.1 6-phosphogluconolactonase-like protein [Zobellia galactanivorans]
MLSFFVGSYTKSINPEAVCVGHGIYSLMLNTDTGGIVSLSTENCCNPSYLITSENGEFLYCITELNELDAPQIIAYKINDGFSLSFLNKRSINGGYPCHLEKFDSNILVACYGTGNVIRFPLESSGRLQVGKENYYHEGSGAVMNRQESPHAHQIAIQPVTSNIYVCDLGIDCIKAYSLKEGKLYPNAHNDFKMPDGSGPRHLVFNKNGDLAYVLNELSGAVSVLRNENGSFKSLYAYSSLPGKYFGKPSSSAIRLHPKGLFLYTANRVLEAITIFKVMKDQLLLVGFHYTNGKELREFNISPDGKWLIACHQNSHDIVVFRIKENGTLMEVSRTKKMKSPVCVAFSRVDLYASV